MKMLVIFIFNGLEMVIFVDFGVNLFDVLWWGCGDFMFKYGCG